MRETITRNYAEARELEKQQQQPNNREKAAACKAKVFHVQSPPVSVRAVFHAGYQGKELN
jgi:hypothetical protein